MRQSLGSFQDSMGMELGWGQSRESVTLPAEKKSLKASWRWRHEVWEEAGWGGRVGMAPQTQEQHEQRPRGHADGQPCKSVGCEGMLRGTSLGGWVGSMWRGYTLGFELYSVEDGESGADDPAWCCPLLLPSLPGTPFRVTLP